MPGRGEPMPWNKIKSMFVVPDQPAGDVDQTLKDLEKYEVPPDVPAAPMPEVTATVASLSGKIDFQALYDQAAIPEVTRDQEGVASQCAAEEARLQGARVFFGYVGDLPAPGR